MARLPYASQADEGGAAGRPCTILANPGYDVGTINEVGVLSERDHGEGLALACKSLATQRLIIRLSVPFASMEFTM